LSIFYSGSGLYSIGHQKQLFPSAALASLQYELPVSKWIFCEQSSENAKALKIRVNKYFRGKNVVIFESKPEQLIDKFRTYVPQSKGAYKVAVFCLVDPFSIDIPFTTIDKLNDLGFSFLIPYTFSLGGRLDYNFYIKEQRDRLKKYLGGFQDIEKLEDVKSNFEFYKKLVKIQQNNMLDAWIEYYTFGTQAQFRTYGNAVVPHGLLFEAAFYKNSIGRHSKADKYTISVILAPRNKRNTKNVRPYTKKIMLQIGEILISDDVIEKEFVCNLDKCKGRLLRGG
jgi:three-Cys-motif partner protein